MDNSDAMAKVIELMTSNDGRYEKYLDMVGNPCMSSNKAELFQSKNNRVLVLN